MELGPRAKEYFGIGADGLTDDQRRIKELEAALEAAQEALYYRDGLDFAYRGRIVGQWIVDVLGQKK